MNDLQKRRGKEGGVSTIEFGLLVPIIFSLFLAIVQIIIYLQSSLATQYAAFIAARAYQVYGTRTLESIHYRRLGSHPYTQKEQSIAEAAAEKIIFESLLWENRKIQVDGDRDSLNRTYKDGRDLSRDGVSETASEGSVRLNILSSRGVEVTYCAPIFAPGLQNLFSLASKNYPCKNSRGSLGSPGLAVVQKAQFGVEPEVTP